MSRNGHNGFTLVELLVVVTIITLLAAMLIPAMETAVGHAQRARCLTNLYGINSALGLYLLDHRQTYPYGFPVPPEQLSAPTPEQGWPTGSKPPHQLLVPYAGQSTKLFYCPGDPDPRGFSWWAFNDYPDFVNPPGQGQELAPGITDPNLLLFPPPPNNRGASYMLSEEATYATAVFDRFVFKASDIAGSPANFAWLSDGIVIVNGWWWKTVDPRDPSHPDPPTDAWQTRLRWDHLGTVSMLFGDGHVRSVEQWAPDIGGINDRVRSQATRDELPDQFGYIAD